MTATKYLATIVLAVAVFAFGVAPATAGPMSLAGDATTLFTGKAIPGTGAADSITTFALPVDVKAVVFYADWTTTADLTAVYAAPAGCVTAANQTSAYYYTNKTSDCVMSWTKIGKQAIRVPREAFGAYSYGGLAIYGTGKDGNAVMSAKYKLEY